MKRFQDSSNLQTNKIPNLQQLVERQGIVDNEDLAAIGAYISSNIQSKRNKIISLYATSLTAHKAVEDINIPAWAHQWTNPTKKSCKYRLQPISPARRGNTSTVCSSNDRDLIVSSRFPCKQQAKPTIFRLRLKSPIKKKTSVSSPKQTIKQQVQCDFKQCFDLRPVLLRKKSKEIGEDKAMTLQGKHQKAKSIDINNQLNPWEYLVLAHEHTLCEL